VMYDVEFNGHIIVEANSPDDACSIAEKIMDKSGAYVYIENAEVY
jgi:hypothetical protein